MTKIKNIVYDLGGVLVDLDMQRCIDTFIALGMKEVAEIINPYYPAEVIGKLEKGEISAHESCVLMRQMSNRPDVTDEQIAEAYGAFLIGVQAAKLRQIEALRARGIRTYVLSNNNPIAMPYIREQFRIDGHTMDHYFDKIYLSYQMRELKPSEAIFLKMIADSGMIPTETLFIDDGEKNIRTACGLGFQTHLAVPDEDFGPLYERIDKQDA